MKIGKNLQQKLLYPAKISFIFNDEIKRFTDKQKLRIQHPKISLTINAKETYLGRKHKQRKRPKTQTPGNSLVIQKMSIQLSD